MPNFVMADTTQLSYIKEQNWGVIPATPAMTKLRMTGENFAFNPNTVVSTELTPNRDVPDVILASAGATGGFNFELSYGSYDDILSSLMFNDWSGDTLKNGITQKPLSFEKKFYRGIGDMETPVYDYYRYSGMVADTMSLSITANQIITGSFGFIGKGATEANDIVEGETYLEASTNDILSASHDVGELTIQGIEGYTPKVMSVELNISNNLQGAGAVGSVDYADIGAGSFNLSGNMELYYENNALYKSFLNSTALSLSLTLGKTPQKKYKITIPKLKLSSCEIVAQGQNTYVMCNAGFQGLKDSELGATIKIERNVA